MNREEFISICKECDITVDGNDGYWQGHPVLSYREDEEAMHAGFFRQRKIVK